MELKLTEMDNTQSSAEFIDRPIDCRRLNLSIRFYSLKAEKVQKLCNQLITFACNQIGTNAVFCWRFGGKILGKKAFWDTLQQPFKAQLGVSAGFESYKISSIVYNMETYKQYRRFVQRINPTYHFGWNIDPTVGLSSIDYPNYLDELMCKKELEKTELLQEICGIFSEQNKRHISLHVNSDYSVKFSADPYYYQTGLFYGKAEISFSVFALSSLLDSIAQRFGEFAEILSNYYVNTNIHVGIQSNYLSEVPYMRYFGNHVAMDGTHEEALCLPKEWYPSYYLCDVQWLNIISPLTKSLITTSVDENVCKKGFCVRSLQNGALLVRGCDLISEFDIPTVLEIKHFLLDTLYPGRSSVPIRGLIPKHGEQRIYEWCPRNDWAIVPVEDHEIHIIGTDLVYISSNAMTYY